MCYKFSINPAELQHIYQSIHRNIQIKGNTDKFIFHAFTSACKRVGLHNK